MYLQQLQQQQYLLGGCDVLRTTHFGDEHVMTPIHFALNSIVYNDMMATIVNWEDSSAR